MSGPDHVFSPMNDAAARAIVSWRYEAPHDHHDTAKDHHTGCGEYPFLPMTHDA